MNKVNNFLQLIRFYMLLDNYKGNTTSLQQSNVMWLVIMHQHLQMTPEKPTQNPMIQLLYKH